MLISEKDRFRPVMCKFLEVLGYESIQEYSEKPFDITAVKDGKKICFKCQYDIEAISEKKITALCDSVKGAGYDKLVFITNSSFSSAAKKKAMESNVELWDRNTIDRMSIGVMDTFKDEKPEEKKSGKGLYVVFAIILILAAAAAAYYFFLR